ncbi:glycerol-3-phosphate acyltransferase PlsY [Caldalkalibacillus uzonensis]|uniref:Glycerol-3-phosphate acyltransferase n=1 Tax=Caldalkalibacillus uzonensis TaxID=353224 RepID=A0ABU0CSZ4_9BACI|nr:glycerol-3-phosphate acyltransferase [Caldalkalibacillus uzonensis]MDQ0338989.1 glycerol-3-phosphate acyltransferase PlsY [Caldalkalibacillus uzonensis]
MNTLLLFCLLAYLIGSIPTGKIVASLKGIDIQQVGTGNIGASNAYLTMGKKAGLLVLLGDFGKAYLLVDLALRYLSFGETSIVGLFLILGNMKSLFLRFSGGKGIATSLGVFLATEPLVGFVLVLCWGAGLVFAKYMFLFAMMGTMIVPFTYYKLTYDLLALFISFLICLLILLKHRKNFKLKSRKGPEVQKI